MQSCPERLGVWTSAYEVGEHNSAHKTGGRNFSQQVRTQADWLTWASGVSSHLGVGGTSGSASWDLGPGPESQRLHQVRLTQCPGREQGSCRGAGEVSALSKHTGSDKNHAGALLGAAGAGVRSEPGSASGSCFPHSYVVGLRQELMQCEWGRGSRLRSRRCSCNIVMGPRERGGPSRPSAEGVCSDATWAALALTLEMSARHACFPAIRAFVFLSEQREVVPRGPRVRGRAGGRI